MFPKSDRASFREVLAAAAVAPPPAPRGARLPAFVHLFQEPQDADKKLADLKLLIGGLGSVGGRIALHAARLQPAEIWMVDHGVFKRESLLTQEIGPHEVGRPKASAMAERCKAISPQTRVFACDGPIQHLPQGDFADATLAFLATDNLAAEVEIGERCGRFGVPMIQASVHGPTLVAQVRTFSNDECGPCPACGFGEEERRHWAEHVTHSCQGEFIAPDAPPTVSTSSLCSLAADLAWNQALRLLLGLGEPVGDTLLTWCGYTTRTLTAPLRRNPDCPARHDRWSVVAVDARLADRTLAEVARLGGFSHADKCGFRVEDHSYVTSIRCCGAEQRVDRFVQAGHSAATCRACGASIQPGVYDRHAVIGRGLIDLDTPLADLGAADPTCVVVEADGRTALILQEVRS